MINENFIYLGVIINLLGGISYIKDTLRGKAKPNRISWALWAVPVMIAAFAQMSQGVGLQALATFVVGLVPLLVFLSSFINKQAYWKLTRFDMVCGALSVSGLVAWYISKDANTAIIFSIFADLLAGIPTLIKSYKFPETENWVEFLSALISLSITMLTFKTWTFAYWGFPLYLFIFDLAVFMLIKFKLGKRINLFIRFNSA